MPDDIVLAHTAARLLGVIARDTMPAPSPARAADRLVDLAYSIATADNPKFARDLLLRAAAVALAAAMALDEEEARRRL